MRSRVLATLGFVAAAVLSMGCDGSSGSGDDRDGGTGGDGGGGEGGGPPSVVFDESRLHEIELSLSPDDWQSILDDSRGDEWRTATISYDGVVVRDVGVRPAGESSRFPGNPKMSMRIKIDAFRKAELAGLEELKLEGMWGDPSMMRERLAYWMFRERMPAPRFAHGRLVVNGMPRGLYSVEEVWEEEALKDRFPSPIGPLYRIRGNAPLDPYVYAGTDPGLYVPLPWDPVTERPPEDHFVIAPFLRVLAEAPQDLERVCDVELLLEYLATNAAVTNVDGFTGSFEVDDHFQYYEPQSGRFLILAWDPDNTFGSLNDSPERSIFKNFEKSIVTKLIRDTPDLRARYIAKLAAVMAQLPVSAISDRIDFINAQIRAAAHEDALKVWPNDHFDFSVGYIKTFAADRYTSLEQQLEAGREGETGREER